MKTVFRSKEIAHVWANSGAPRGRSPGNLSFEGDAILSYSTVIGRRIRSRGKVAYVVDCARFSNSTSKSQGRVLRAIPEGEKVFVVREGGRGQDLAFTPAELARLYEKRASELAGELPSRYARIRAQQWQAVTAELEKARDVLAFFGMGTARLDKKIAARKAGDSTAAETLAAERIKREAARKAKEKRELKERTDRNTQKALAFINGERSPKWIDKPHQSALDTLAPELRERLLAAIAEHNAGLKSRWRAGESVAVPWDCPVMLRVDGDEMETSKGARVPLADARRTYRFAHAMRAKGWHRNGETHAVGMYQLDAVNAAGVVAGCHRVSWEEIEAFAQSQGWTE